jgi:16S rRNA (guanine527-N7)-methyltransferase
MDALELLRLQAAAWGLSLAPDQLARLERFALFLRDYEEANVIGTRELRGIILDHILDSLSSFLFEPLWVARRLADVGSGGGLPGVPIKIVEPELRTTLVESTAKKVLFLHRATENLALEGVEVMSARVEEIARVDEYRGTYDVATARAVARLSVVAEYCVPLLRVGGCVISMKARLENQEMAEGERAAEQLGARVTDLIRVPRLPEIETKERCLVIIEKVGETPGEYPRKVGVPAKKPLGMV